MKIILVQPSIIRFKWEIEVLLKNLEDLSFNLSNIILVFDNNNINIVNYFKTQTKCQVFSYNDKRKDKHYIPSIQPYLWSVFLKNNPEMEKETFFYIDSDVIFREIPNFKNLKYSEKTWCGSDCSSYLNYEYIKQCDNGLDVLQKMCDIVGIETNQVKELKDNCVGAQRILVRPTFEYWNKVYLDCVLLWDAIKDLDTNLQKWTVSMWSELWNMIYFGIQPIVEKELSFCWATDPIKYWEKNKIFHNAGVVDNHSNMFFKGDFINREPFNESFTNLDKEKCSYKYVEAIRKVK